MKKLSIISVFALLFILTLLVVHFKNQEEICMETPSPKHQEAKAKVVSSPRYHEDISYDVEMGEIERTSITFIMGEDKHDSDNQYYAEAEKYYRNNPNTFHEVLVTSCRSLKEIRDYLEQHPTDDGLPYGKINVIVHSNEWRGVGMSVLPDGDRMNIRNVRAAINDGSLQPLPDEVLDFETEITIYGCGLGKNEKLLSIIAEALGGKDMESPLVRSSKLFIQYASTTDESSRYLTEYWYGFFKTGYRPSNTELAQQLSSRYMDEEVEWMEALDRTEPRFPGDSYHYYFNVPVNWMVTYPDKNEMPQLSTPEEKTKWLNEQTELIAAIAEAQIPMDKFRWMFKKTTYTFDDGTTEPAIKVEGKSSILCILRSMTIENYDNPNRPLPFEPDVNDERFYTSAKANTHPPILSLK